MNYFLKKSAVILVALSLIVTSTVTGVFAEEISNEQEPLDQPSIEQISNTIAITKNENTDTMSVVLTWDAVESAQHYLIKVSCEGNSEEPVDTKECSFEFSNMIEGITYSFIVEAYDESDELIAAGSCESTLTKPEEPAIEKVRNVRVIRGYKSVTLKWSTVEGAQGYRVYRRYINGTANDTVKPSTPVATVRGTSYKMSMYPERKYNFWIVAYAVSGDSEVVSDAAYIKNVQKAHPLYYTLQIKKTLTLKCQCGGHRAVSRKFTRGQKVSAYWFSNGVYRAKIGSHRYHFKAIYCSGGQSKPEANNPLNKEEIEYFIKELKPKKKTKYIIVATLYTQHGYLMKRDSKGTYRMVRHFPLSSGKAATPTPRGTNLKVWQRIKSRHGRPKWMCFYSINAFHGLKGKEKIRGNTSSHGCIRLNNADRDYLWKTVPLNSGVVVY